ncbi:Uncharacterised protein [Serratia fonticola]|uniref:hypothetical protein n=1 Tax=Serratia fonticola TaxID=47917 RepID=UPI002177C428|nr:hypothetical protein [Serratia fonticola]CAI2044284.1 Uncharacterised protein [Serratia fonticola]
MKQNLNKMVSSGIASIGIMLSQTAPLQAETITIGKGAGIKWEGMPFNQTLSGALLSADLYPSYGLLSISNGKSTCMSSNTLIDIAGFKALPLSGVRGIGLIPRATGTATYYRYGGGMNTLHGTIGFPDTTGSTSIGTKVTSPPNKAWCLPPDMSNSTFFYSATMNRTASLSGTWVLVADGTQQAGEVTIEPMFFGSFSAVSGGDRTVQILPSNITLRISTLECTVNTPTAINFGTVNRFEPAGAQMAIQSVPLVTTCGQPTDRINANINLQFRALTGNYNGESTRLAFAQGGDIYLTGEIDKGVTGSGACNATTGLRFDNTPVKIGSITSAEASKTLTNQVTWRMCSGSGAKPSGPVNAQAEMLITFN